MRPSRMSVRPSTTTPADQTSVEKCSASASRAWLSYLLAMRPRARDRHQSTAIEISITAKAQMDGSTSTPRENRRINASQTTHAEGSRRKPVSTQAEKVSIFPGPDQSVAQDGL